MSKKKITLFMILCLAVIFTCGIFTACTEDVVKIQEITVASGPNEIILGQFDYSAYTLKVTYSDGSEETVPVEESMISVNDMLKTYHDGAQTLTVSYQGLTCDFVVAVKRYTFSDVTLNDKTVTYNGSPFALGIEGELPEGTTVSYPNGNSFINAGTYYIKAVLANDLYLTTTVNGVLKIERAVYDVSSYLFQNKTYVYDGKEKSISVEGEIPEELKITYSIGKISTNAMVDAGVYTVTAHFDAGANYEPIDNKQAILTIEKAVYDVSNLKFTDRTDVYNGDKHSIVITNENALPDGVMVRYENNDRVDAGQYTITATFHGDSTNYKDIQPITAVLTISKADISLNNVFLDGASFVYDRQPHSLYFTGILPTGVSFIGYENNAQINVGTYTVKAKFSYHDTVNFNAIQPLTALLEITKATVTGIEFSDEVYTYDGTGKNLSVKNLPQGFNVTYENNGQTEPGDYLVTATFSAGDELTNQNYEPIEPMTARLSIGKISFATGFVDDMVPYDGQVHNIVASKLPSWVTAQYFLVSGESQTPFSGAVEPGTYYIVAKYTIDPSHQEEYEKYYEQIEEGGAELIITKMNFIPEYTNRKLVYSGTEQKVTIDMDKLPVGMTKSDVEAVYRNNTATEEGIYTGSVSIVLSDNARKYYKAPEDQIFRFAIRGNEKVLYTPSFDNQPVEYDGQEHSISVDALPYGLEVNYSKAGFVLPGNHAVKATFTFTDDITEYYYRLPSSYLTDYDGNKYTSVTLTISKQKCNINYNVGPFVYDGLAKTVSVTNLPKWISVEFDYGGQDTTAPGEYSVTATPTITSPEREELYFVEPSQLTLTVTYATARFSFTDLEVQYDGKKHYVGIKGLPDGFLPHSVGDGTAEVGSHSVIISFEKTQGTESMYYKDIATQSVILNINANVVDIASLQIACGNGATRVEQYSTVMDFFRSMVKTDGMTILWTLTGGDVETELTNEDVNNYSFNKGSDEMESRYDLEFKLVLAEQGQEESSGYVFSNGDYSYSAGIYLSINPNQKVIIGSVDEEENKQYLLGKLTDGCTIYQESSIRQFMSEMIGVTADAYDLSFSIDYYNGENKYPSSFSDCHGTSEGGGDFIFVRNTWGNRYCRLSYTLTTREGYCFFDGVTHSHTVSDIVDCSISAVRSLDLRPMKTDFSDYDFEIGQYTSLQDYFHGIIDCESVSIEWTLSRDGLVFMSGTEQEGDYCFTDETQNDIFLEFTASIKNLNVNFSETGYYTEYSKSAMVNVIGRTGVDIQQPTLAVQAIGDSDQKQYRDFFKEVYPIDDIENTTYTWAYEGSDGEKIEGKEGDSFVMLTSGISKIKITYKATNGAVLILSEGKAVESYSIDMDINILPIKMIDIKDVVTYVGVNAVKTIEQHDTLLNQISTLVDGLKAQEESVRYNWSIEYYKGVGEDGVLATEFTDKNVINSQSDYVFGMKSNQSEKVYARVTFRVWVDKDVDNYVLDDRNYYSYAGFFFYDIMERKAIDINSDDITGQTIATNLATVIETDIFTSQMGDNQNTLQSLFYSFNIDNGFSVDKAVITYYKKDNTVASSYEKYTATVTDIAQPYTFPYATYTDGNNPNLPNYILITLDLKTESGFCLIDQNGKGYTEKQIVIKVQVLPILLDKAFDDLVADGVTQQLYRSTVLGFIDSMDEMGNLTSVSWAYTTDNFTTSVTGDLTSDEYIKDGLVVGQNKIEYILWADAQSGFLVEGQYVNIRDIIVPVVAEEKKTALDISTFIDASGIAVYGYYSINDEIIKLLEGAEEHTDWTFCVETTTSTSPVQKSTLSGSKAQDKIIESLGDDTLVRKITVELKPDDGYCLINDKKECVVWDATEYASLTCVLSVLTTSVADITSLVSYWAQNDSTLALRYGYQLNQYCTWKIEGVDVKDIFLGSYSLYLGDTDYTGLAKEVVVPNTNNFVGQQVPFTFTLVPKKGFVLKNGTAYSMSYQCSDVERTIKAFQKVENEYIELQGKTLYASISYIGKSKYYFSECFPSGLSENCDYSATSRLSTSTSSTYKTHADYATKGFSFTYPSDGITKGDSYRVITITITLKDDLSSQYTLVEDDNLFYVKPKKQYVCTFHAMVYDFSTTEWKTATDSLTDLWGCNADDDFDTIKSGDSWRILSESPEVANITMMTLKRQDETRYESVNEFIARKFGIQKADGTGKANAIADCLEISWNVKELIQQDPTAVESWYNKNKTGDIAFGVSTSIKDNVVKHAWVLQLTVTPKEGVYLIDADSGMLTNKTYHFLVMLNAADSQ